MRKYLLVLVAIAFMGVTATDALGCHFGKGRRARNATYSANACTSVPSSVYASQQAFIGYGNGIPVVNTVPVYGNYGATYGNYGTVNNPNGAYYQATGMGLPLPNGW